MSTTYSPEDLAVAQALVDEMKRKQTESDYARDEPILNFPKTNMIDVRAGETRIGIPEGTPPEKAAKILSEYVEAQKAEVRVVRKITGRIEDIQVAVHRICEQRWGTTGRGLSFMGQPPVFEDTVIGVESDGTPITLNVVVSAFNLEPLSAIVEYGGWNHEEYGMCGMISVRSVKKNESNVKAFLDAVEAQVKMASIYKGKVVEFRRRKVTSSRGDYELTHRAVHPDQNIVYNRFTEKRLDYNLFGAIKFAEAFKKAGMKTTFRTLLYGPYGSGKTECTLMTAHAATTNGWTTVFFSPGEDDGIKDLEAAHNLAALYSPSVLVVEDIDRYYQDDNPNAKSYITNILDGMKSKSSGVSILMTTNHLDSIPQAATRPGRMDALIEIGFLDREATERMFRQLLGDELADDVNFDDVYSMVKDTGPSFIRGTFDRARRYSIITNSGELGNVLTTDDLVFAANEMKEQSDMHSSTKESTPSERYLAIMREARKLEAAGLLDPIEENDKLAQGKLDIIDSGVKTLIDNM